MAYRARGAVVDHTYVPVMTGLADQGTYGGYYAGPTQPVPLDATWRGRGRGRGRGRVGRGSRSRSRSREGVDKKKGKMESTNMTNVAVTEDGDVNIYMDVPGKETLRFNRLVTKFAVEGHRGIATVLFDFPDNKEKYAKIEADPSGHIFKTIEEAEDHMRRLPNIMHLFLNEQASVQECPPRRELTGSKGAVVSDVGFVTRGVANLTTGTGVQVTHHVGSVRSEH